MKHNIDLELSKYYFCFSRLTQHISDLGKYRLNDTISILLAECSLTTYDSEPHV